ncbi:MAG: response regulator, partial [Phycisphaeraceae bacterium]
MENSTSILIVDDAEIDRRRAGHLLEQWVALDIRYATDGREALEMIQQHVPAIILTDLQMPRVDGLELVAAVRRDHPDVPVILMTAHGSEEVAANALRCGAISYVPKKHLARDLATTVRRVLRIVRPKRKYDIVLEMLRATEYRFQMDNDPSLVHPLVHYLGEDLARMNLYDETTMMRIGVALDEAIRNAIFHGNLEIGPRLPGMELPDYEALVEQRRHVEPYAERKVHLHICFTREHGTFVVRD